MSKADDLISIVEAAQSAGVVTSTIYRWCKRRGLGLYKKGGRTFVSRGDLQRLMRPRRVRQGKRPSSVSSSEAAPGR
jgi:excisionase family DNA binding protein